MCDPADVRRGLLACTGGPLRTTLIATLACVGAMGCPIEPNDEPKLLVCRGVECIAGNDELRTCGEERSIDTIEPGEGFYVFHVLPRELVLANDTEGKLVVQTVCGTETYPLEYGRLPERDRQRVAAVPIAAPDEVVCGMTVRATLLNHTSSCYRRIGSSAEDGPDDLALHCARLRDACEEEGDTDELGGGSGVGATDDTTSSATGDTGATSDDGRGEETAGAADSTTGTSTSR